MLVDDHSISFFPILSILGEGIEGEKFSLMALWLFFSYLSQREEENRLENHSIEFDWPIEWKQNV